MRTYTCSKLARALGLMAIGVAVVASIGLVVGATVSVRHGDSIGAFGAATAGGLLCWSGAAVIARFTLHPCIDVGPEAIAVVNPWRTVTIDVCDVISVRAGYRGIPINTSTAETRAWAVQKANWSSEWKTAHQGR